MIDSTSRIAELNDLCRKAFGLAGRVVQTDGITALPPATQSAIREKVESFDDFTEDNDPHGEHDFGAFEHEGEKIFWKIDTYAPDMQHGSENPADPKQTVRVLTIMLADEYWGPFRIRKKSYAKQATILSFQRLVESLERGCMAQKYSLLPEGKSEITSH